jgi:hypothetical protein
MQEDVGSLEISVRHAHLSQVLKSLVHVHDKLVHLPLGQLPLALEPFLQIALIAQLRHYIAIAVG